MDNPEVWVRIIAEVIAAGSLVVGVLTFMRSTSQSQKQKIDEAKKRDEQIIRNWQRVAIYKAIGEVNARDGRPISFNDLKHEYVAATVEFTDTEIPKNEIRDSALRLALMSLLEGKLVELLEDGKYRLVFRSSWDLRRQEIELIKLSEERIISNIKSTLYKNKGLDKIELWRALKVQETDHNLYYDMIDKMITDNTIKLAAGGTLSLSTVVHPT